MPIRASRRLVAFAGDAAELSGNPVSDVMGPRMVAIRVVDVKGLEPFLRAWSDMRVSGDTDALATVFDTAALPGKNGRYRGPTFAECVDYLEAGGGSHPD